MRHERPQHYTIYRRFFCAENRMRLKERISGRGAGRHYCPLTSKKAGSETNMAVLVWSLFIVLVIYLLVSVIPSLVRFIAHYHHLSRALCDLPGWPRHWLWGNLHNIRAEEAIWLKWHDYIFQNRHKMCVVWLGPLKPMVMVHHCSLARRALQLTKDPYIYNFLNPWLGDGLLVSEGKKWYRNRRLLTPAFHFDILIPYVQVYNSCLETFVQKCKTFADKGEPVKVFDNFSRLTLDILLQCAFSYKSGCQDTDVQHPYICSVYELIHLLSHRIENPFYHIDWLFHLTPGGQRMRKACRIVHKHAENVISKRKRDLLFHGALSTMTTEDLRKQKNVLDFLDILLLARDEDGKGLTDLEIRNEVDTFMFEGHDTTTSSLSWTLYLLAKHPEHQEKVRQEVRSVLCGREWLEYEDIKDLKYTHWCIKEAMRLYPPVFSIYRITDKDFELNGHIIPKGVTVSVNIYDIHRHQDTWKRPHEFDPLRFHPDSCKNRDAYAYIPFSASQRNCIGQNFAVNEERIVVATLVNLFSLALVEGHKVEIVPKVVLRTKYDIKVLFTTLRD